MSDGQFSGKTAFEGFFITLTVASAAEVDQYHAALSAGGSVLRPLERTFFSPRFGMLKDKFGVGWVVYATGSE